MVVSRAQKASPFRTEIMSKNSPAVQTKPEVVDETRQSDVEVDVLKTDSKAELQVRGEPCICIFELVSG